MHSTELPTYQIDFNETLLLRYVYIRCAVRTRVARPYPLLRNTAEEKAFVPVRPTLLTRCVTVINSHPQVFLIVRCDTAVSHNINCGNLVWVWKLVSRLRVIPRIAFTTDLSLFSTTEEATTEIRRGMLGSTLANVVLILKSLFKSLY